MKKELLNGIFAIGLSLYTQKTLIIGDVHMGYEEAVNKQGVLIPRHQFWDTKARIEHIFNELEKKKLPIKRVIINGDLKHEFGTISETEWRNTLGLLDYILKKCSNILLIKGNHDKILWPIANKREVEIKDYELINNVLVCHGDVMPKKDILQKAKIIIIGHEHPAVGLRERSRMEKFKCYLKGKWKGKMLIAMPSFNTAVEGSDVLREGNLSPFLSDIDDFEVIVAGEDGKLMEFGTVKRLKQFQDSF